MFNVKFQAYLNKDIVDIIKKENPERLFNMYDDGGDLIYNDIKVFIDGRADLYSKYNYKDYLNMSADSHQVYIYLYIFPTEQTALYFHKVLNLCCIKHSFYMIYQ